MKIIYKILMIIINIIFVVVVITIIIFIILVKRNTIKILFVYCPYSSAAVYVRRGQLHG